MDVMLHEFGRYVADTHRNSAYAAAIAEIVRPGDVVCDLGTGFGFLALLCARAGARRVYAIEQGPYLDLARAIAHDNGLGDRIQWIAGNSLAVVLPEPVDVIVSETLGQWALEEFTVEYLADAVRRFGKTGVRVMPQFLELAVAPAEAAGQWASSITADGIQWSCVEGFDLRRLQQSIALAAAAPYVAVRGADVILLSAPIPLVQFTLGGSPSSRFARIVDAEIERHGVCDGWLGMFRAQLSPRIQISTWPGAPSTHWNNVIFPLPARRTVAVRERLRAGFSFMGANGWSFRAEPSDSGSDPRR